MARHDKTWVSGERVAGKRVPLEAKSRDKQRGNKFFGLNVDARRELVEKDIEVFLAKGGKVRVFGPNVTIMNKTGNMYTTNAPFLHERKD